MKKREPIDLPVENAIIIVRLDFEAVGRSVGLSRKLFLEPSYERYYFGST